MRGRVCLLASAQAEISLGKILCMPKAGGGFASPDRTDAVTMMSRNYLLQGPLGEGCQGAATLGTAEEVGQKVCLGCCRRRYAITLILGSSRGCRVRRVGLFPQG